MTSHRSECFSDAWGCFKGDVPRARPYQGWVYDRKLRRQVHVGHAETQSGAVELGRLYAAARSAGSAASAPELRALVRSVRRDRASGQASLPIGDDFDVIARQVDRCAASPRSKRTEGQRAGGTPERPGRKAPRLLASARYAVDACKVEG